MQCPLIQGAPTGRGEAPPNTETEEIAVEKSYFPDLHKMTVSGRWDRKWIKSQISIAIFIWKFQNFLNKFQSPKLAKICR